MCAAAVIISRCWVDAHALVQLSVQQKYDFQNIEKYGVLGGKKYCRKTWDLLSSRAAAARWRGGDGCSLPATHQIGRSTILNISGNSLDLPIHVLRVVWRSVMQSCQWFAPPSCGRLDCRHCKSFWSDQKRSVPISTSRCTITFILGLSVSSYRQSWQVMVGYGTIQHFSISALGLTLFSTSYTLTPLSLSVFELKYTVFGA